MGGICGFTGKLHDQNLILKKMLSKTIYTKSIDYNVFIDENISIGCKYLKITDIYRGDQPIFNEDKSIALVLDGEIYNYLELKEKLRKKNHVFKNNSDAEVLIHLYEQYGLELFKYLRGMFVFVIYDSRKKIIFGSRDFFGIKSIYYYKSKNNDFIFASEIKNLIEHPDVELSFNYKIMESYLSFGYSTSDESFFKNIYKIPSGNYFVFDLNRKENNLEIKRFFVQHFSYLEGSQKDFELKAKNALDNSFHMHEDSNHNSGVLLSSGLSSSYITLNLLIDKNFTVGFDCNNYSEIDNTKNFCKNNNKKNFSKKINSNDYFNVTDKVIYYLEEPNADLKSIAFYYACNIASRETKVCFSGHGANELFCGYDYYQEPSNLFFINFIPKFIRNFFLFLLEKIRSSFKIKKNIGYILKDLDKRYIDRKKIFDIDEIKDILLYKDINESHIKKVKILCDNVVAYTDEAKMQYLDINLSLINSDLNIINKMSMANSIEVRFPYLDKEIYEIAFSLPKNLKIKKISTKYIFRKAVEKSVSNNIYKKKHLDLEVPLKFWLREDKYYKLILDEFKSEIAGCFFDQKKILKLLDDHKNFIKIDNSRKIWCIYIFLIWYKIFLNGNK
ncbi:MAG: asparagine synthase (glutamine-hydrolyzing) [Clostridiales bacterium]|jgi:asparagine synthase (glutamine-hydrolysing)|nr:asparagine synthase (glutamine-hydrolyzing) [Clostridiales bacterium]